MSVLYASHRCKLDWLSRIQARRGEPAVAAVATQYGQQIGRGRLRRRTLEKVRSVQHGKYRQRRQCQRRCGKPSPTMPVRFQVVRRSIYEFGEDALSTGVSSRLPYGESTLPRIISSSDRATRGFTAPS